MAMTVRRTHKSTIRRDDLSNILNAALRVGEVIQNVRRLESHFGHGGSICPSGYGASQSVHFTPEKLEAIWRS